MTSKFVLNPEVGQKDHLGLLLACVVALDGGVVSFRAVECLYFALTFITIKRFFVFLAFNTVIIYFVLFSNTSQFKVITISPYILNTAYITGW